MKIIYVVFLKIDFNMQINFTLIIKVKLKKIYILEIRNKNHRFNSTGD